MSVALITPAPLESNSLYIYSQYSTYSVTQQGAIKMFTGFLITPQFSEPLKVLSAQSWDLWVNYTKDRYELYKSSYFRGFPQSGELVGKGTGEDSPLPDTTYPAYTSMIRAILTRHGLTPWAPPDDWKWPVTPPDESTFNLEWEKFIAYQRAGHPAYSHKKR